MELEFLTAPSKDGGILHTPPLRERSLACSRSLYSKQSIRRVGYDGVERVSGLSVQPREAIFVMQYGKEMGKRVLSLSNRTSKWYCRRLGDCLTGTIHALP